MRVEAALVEFLRQSGLAPIKGKAQGDANFPRLHYWMVDDRADQSVTGGETINRLAHFRVEAIGRGESGYEDARQLMDIVRTAQGENHLGGLEFRRFRGWMPLAGAGVWVQATRIDQVQAGDEEQPVEPRAKSIFVVAIDVTLSYVGA